MEKKIEKVKDSILQGWSDEWFINDWLSKREELLIILLPLVKDEHLHNGIWTSVQRDIKESEEEKDG